jgi:tetratricopeptide (TPR) repeat protein
MADPARGRLQQWAVILWMLGVAGCATYTDTLRQSHTAAERGDYEAGVRALNDILDVAGPEQLPDQWTANKPLVVLERAMLLQAQGQYKWSARDLSAAETELEYLDLKLDTAGSIGKYIYSDSAKTYKAQPIEHLALNALNMLNYLAMDDLEGASVEARRFTIARQYLESSAQNSDERSGGAFGSYLAGFVFEKSGEPDRALRYYEEALAAGDLIALREPVLRLAARGRYVGQKLKAYLHKLEESRSDVKTARPAVADPNGGEILIVLGIGRVPYKIPKRMAIGVALGYAGLWVSGDPDILSRSIFKFVVYPELVTPESEVTGAAVNVNGRDFPVELLTDLGAEITREYQAIKPKIIGAALSRMIARAVAAEGTRYLAGKKEKARGTLAALATEAALTSLDKPDTRSWTFLPARIYVCRVRVEPGAHEVRVELFGEARQTRTIPVVVPPGGYSVVVITEPRGSQETTGKFPDEKRGPAVLKRCLSF